MRASSPGSGVVRVCEASPRRSPQRRPSSTTRSRPRPPDEGDRGFALLEALFVIPLVFAIILTAAQLGEWWYARQLALSAAQEGARAARAYNGTDAAGASSATGYLTQIDGHVGRILLNPTVTVRRSRTLVTVTVHGHIPALVPFIPSVVNEQSRGVPETFVPAG